jgi:DNA-binding transcriptional MocR family regulator
MSQYEEGRHYIVLNAIRASMVLRQKCPTLKQLASITGIKAPTVHFYMKKLVAEGLIRREKNARAFELTGSAHFMQIPAARQKHDRSPRRSEQRRVAKPTKEYEAERFELAVALGKANDLRASGSGISATHDRLSLFSRGGIRGEKMG